MRETVRLIVGEVVGHDASLMDTILHHPASPTCFDCLKSIVRRFSDSCYSFSKVQIADLLNKILYPLNDI